MKRYTLFILALLAFAFGRAQNKDLERLLQKQRSNPAIEYVNLLETGPEAENVKVAETLDFDDSLYLVRHFVEEYKQIKGSKKLKPSKVLSIDGNFFMKMALNKAIAIRLWEDENGYKDAIIEFDGCKYLVIHLGGFYKVEEIAKYIGITGAH